MQIPSQLLGEVSSFRYSLRGVNTQPWIDSAIKTIEVSKPKMTMKLEHHSLPLGAYQLRPNPLGMVSQCSGIHSLAQLLQLMRNPHLLGILKALRDHLNHPLPIPYQLRVFFNESYQVCPR
jgi:hypothetical protein